MPEIEMTQKAAWMHAFSTFNHIEDKVSLNRGVEYVLAAIRRGDLKPTVGRVYALADCLQALEDQLESRPRRGKIVIKP